MDVEITVEVDGRKVATVKQDLATDAALSLEEQVERVKDRVGGVVLEAGFEEFAAGLRRPCCCGRPMENRGREPVTLMSQSGEVVLSRRRYRCRECRVWRRPADESICCGRHRVTRLLARQICQLATLEHFPHLEQTVADQHGVHVGHDLMQQLALEVGTAADEKRRADADVWASTPPESRRWPEPEVTPKRVYVSCDGIMYCTNETEPVPNGDGENRLIWRQMRVGCVYWQTENERWHKRVIWGHENAESFGASLYRLACRCGYREAKEKIFAADGGEWCWSIHERYFADAEGILDWFHASEHVWSCARQRDAPAVATAWADQALAVLRDAGGAGLLDWLQRQRPPTRGRKRQTLDALIRYVRNHVELMDYPRYRNHEWQIGTGMVESTAKQLVGTRLKGPGMHWSTPGAIAITALRAQDLNHQWHTFWNTLSLNNDP
jgi:hypothetical protein